MTLEPSVVIFQALDIKINFNLHISFCQGQIKKKKHFALGHSVHCVINFYI